MDFWRKNWWVFLFCLSFGATYFHFRTEKLKEVGHLKSRLVTMENEKSSALMARVDLKERLGSQNDPAWIEMVLMRDLGVVPEGFLKVHFNK